MNSTYIVILIVLFAAYVSLLMLFSIRRRRKELNSASSVLSQRLSSVGDEPKIKPEPKIKLDLDLAVEKNDDTGLYRALTTVLNPTPGEHYSFAFYLLVDREQVEVRWHENSPEFEFMLPNYGRNKEIVAFVKDERGDVFTEKKQLKVISAE